MRLLPGLSSLAVVCAFGPALADTIVEDVSFSGNNAGGDVSVFGPFFNPALGTLDSVSAVVTGTYTPKVFLYSATSQTTASVRYFFGVPGDTIMGTVGAVTLFGAGGAPFGSAFTGAPEGFDFATGPLPNPSSYVGGYPAFATTLFGNVEVYARPGPGESWGAYDDLSNFSGQVSLTYTYTVPEPSSFALLALGAGLVGVATGRKRVFGITG